MGLKFSILGFRLGGKIWQVFFGGDLIYVVIFFFAYSKLSDLIPHNVIVYLFIFSSIYLFYKPFILYYKIEELKMLFVQE